MTHYTVMVLTKDEPSPQVLATALAPFDENVDVEPYRRYERGEPKDHWWAREEIKEGRLPADLTWEQFVEAYNKHYGDDDENYLYDADEGRAYQMSTYNPLSKWDWYEEGGRWKGSLLHTDGARVNRLQRRDLDIAQMRGRAELRFRERAEPFRAVYADSGMTFVPWADFLEQVDAKEMTIDQARQRYHDQPALVRVERRAKELNPEYWRGDHQWQRWLVADDEFERQCKMEAAAAVPCFATLDLDGSWHEPGRMGWWGMSSDTESDRIGYYEAMNALIESLDDDVWLTVVDCHI